ncbi:hypothetical protein BDQ17DRAFT_1330031 [Cyathus striatus]|nr:hypothetical protein BDQ17DRAFT_1330031 [Cyathus striatus]
MSNYAWRLRNNSQYRKASLTLKPPIRIPTEVLDDVSTTFTFTDMVYYSEGYVPRRRIHLLSIGAAWKQLLWMQNWKAPVMRACCRGEIVRGYSGVERICTEIVHYQPSKIPGDDSPIYFRYVLRSVARAIYRHFSSTRGVYSIAKRLSEDRIPSERYEASAARKGHVGVGGMDSTLDQYIILYAREKWAWEECLLAFTLRYLQLTLNAHGEALHTSFTTLSQGAVHFSSQSTTDTPIHHLPGVLPLPPPEDSRIPSHTDAPLAPNSRFIIVLPLWGLYLLQRSYIYGTPRIGEHTSACGSSPHLTDAIESHPSCSVSLSPPLCSYASLIRLRKICMYTTLRLLALFPSTVPNITP